MLRQTVTVMYLGKSLIQIGREVITFISINQREPRIELCKAPQWRSGRTGRKLQELDPFFSIEVVQDLPECNNCRMISSKASIIVVAHFVVDSVFL